MNDFQIGDLVKVKDRRDLVYVSVAPREQRAGVADPHQLGMVMAINKLEKEITVKFPILQKTYNLYIPWYYIEIIKKAMI